MTSRDTALLVVDVQLGLVESGAHQSAEVVARIKGLIESARAAGTPVIYMQHNGHAEGAIAPGTRGWQICPEIAPAEGELVIRKNASDSFYETTLQSELEARGIRKIVVVGFRTEYCVDTTCRSATTFGFDVTLASDAHSTNDSEVLPADKVIAHHNATLDDFGNDLHVVTIKLASEVTF